MVTRDADPPYRGRDAEMQLVHHAIEAAASGRVTGVIVEGEAGIGKSRLLSEALAAARGRGHLVVSGRAEELERTRPFGVLVDAFECSMSSRDPQRAEIAALVATGGDGRAVTVTSDPGLQFQVVDGFVDLVEAEALRCPMVIGVDDLQWADPSSLLVLDALVRRLAYVPVALVGCLRPEPHLAELQRMVDTLDAAGGHRIALGGLGEETVEGLVAEIVEAEPGPGLMAEVSAAAGNALFVVELVSALVEEGAIDVVDGRAEVRETILPPSLRLTILRRLGFLSADALDLLRLASILGSRFTLVELSTIAARPAFEVSSMLREAFTAGVLTDEGDRVRFRHDLIRAAVYADLPRSVRVGLHREAGQRLAASGAPAVRVAEHFARAAEPGDANAIAWLTTAAREAAPTSPSIAADLLDRAIDLTVASGAGRDALLVERASILMWAGRIGEAEATCRSLLERPHDPALEAPARTALGTCLLARGRRRQALQELELIGQTATDPQRAASRGLMSIVNISLGHLETAATGAEQARSAATRADDDAGLSLAMTALAIIEEFRAQLRDALESSDEAVRRAGNSPARQGHRYPHHLVRGHILLELDRPADARATLETGMRVSEELGVRWTLAAYQTALAVERFAVGEWDEAISAVEAALELAEETGERHNIDVLLGHSVLALIALHRNDLARAEHAASAVASEFEDGGPRYRAHWSARARALLLETSGDTAEAYATLADCWDRCATSGLAIEYPMLGPDLVRLAMATGEHARADQVASAVAAVAASNDVASLTGAALRCRGLLRSDPDVLRAAVDVYAQSPRVLELGLAAEDAGTLLGQAGDVAAAVPLFDQALEVYGQLDATRDIARTQAALRALGIRRGPRGPRGRPRTGWDSLTPTEHEVADLVAEGLSNPQIGERLFVSRRTVQTHLAHVFRKLQMSSRTELAAAVTRRRERG